LRDRPGDVVGILLECCRDSVEMSRKYLKPGSNREFSFADHENLFRMVGKSFQKCFVNAKGILQEYSGRILEEYCRNIVGIL